MEARTFPITSDGTQAGTLSLKEPRKDILSLVRHYIKIAEQQVNTGPKELSREVEEYFLKNDWQEREEELETAVKKACILSEGPVLQKEDFDLKYRQVRSIGRFIEEKLRAFMPNIKNFEKFNLYGTVMPEVERSLILMVLRETKGNQVKAAKLLGINRNTLRDKIKKLKIKVKS